MTAATRHVLLRDRRQWLGERRGVEIDRDGAMTLLRVPGPADGKAIDLPGPYFAGVSGIAAGPCDSVFVSDTANDRVLLIEPRCGTTAVLGGTGLAATPGALRAPRGLALDETALLVADSGHARVQALALPALEPHCAWDAPLVRPVGVARDSAGRIYVLDELLARVCRYSASGAPDTAYDASVAASGALHAPCFLAVGADDMLLVADRNAKRVQCFDADGTFSHTLPEPHELPWSPGALAAFEDRLYVADATSGRILVYGIDGVHQGHVAGYRGPVTALAVDRAGDLYIKPGLDARYYRYAAAAGHVANGRLEAGPFDAGEAQEWFSVALDAVTDGKTRATLNIAQSDAPLPQPAAADWVAVGADGALCALRVPAGVPPLPRRHLWLRVGLATEDWRLTPVVRQARAATPGENYFHFLPAIYEREDQQTHFLERLLALLQSEISRVEATIDDMPRQADAAFARASALPWLAAWLAFELPEIAGDDERRTLISEAVKFAERRGTAGSIRAHVETYTGMRPALIEAFEARGLWVLGHASRLGFDTALPALDPHGMVVPDPAHADGSGGKCCAATVGSAVVGHAGPLAPAAVGQPLFTETAHRFCVYVPRYPAAAPGVLQEMTRILDTEKPAHTDYRLCLVDPDMRIGFQSQIGVDTIVGGAPAPMSLSGSHLGYDSRLRGNAAGAGRVGQDATIGSGTILG